MLKNPFRLDKGGEERLTNQKSRDEYWQERLTRQAKMTEKPYRGHAEGFSEGSGYL